MCRCGKERVQRRWGGRVLGKFKEHEEALCGWRGGKVGVEEKRAERVCVCVCVCVCVGAGWIIQPGRVTLSEMGNNWWPGAEK